MTIDILMRFFCRFVEFNIFVIFCSSFFYSFYYFIQPQSLPASVTALTFAYKAPVVSRSPASQSESEEPIRTDFLIPSWRHSKSHSFDSSFELIRFYGKAPKTAFHSVNYRVFYPQAQLVLELYFNPEDWVYSSEFFPLRPGANIFHLETRDRTGKWKKKNEWNVKYKPIKKANVQESH